MTTKLSQSTVSDHRSLRVWQAGMSFAEYTYSVTKRFPAHERFGLTAQIRRSAVSIAANIAEGNGRTHRKEYVHHLSIARGSLRETSTLWELARRLGYCDPRKVATAEEAVDHIGRMLTRLIRSLKQP